MGRWDRYRSVGQAWYRTEGPFEEGARYSFRLLCPMAGAFAVFAAVVGEWAVAAVFGVATLYTGRWLIKNFRKRRSPG